MVNPPLKQDIFLSIDLDFWCRRSIQETKTFFELMQKTLLPKNPIIWVEHHDEMLPHIAILTGERIVNIDFHSDLTSHQNWEEHLKNPKAPNNIELNCGTWGNHVPWPKKTEFWWVYPHKCCIAGKNNHHNTSGWCHTKKNPFLQHGKTNTIAACNWEKTKMSYGNEKKLLKKIAPQICGVGICLSKDFLVIDKTQTIKFFQKEKKKHHAITL